MNGVNSTFYTFLNNIGKNALNLILEKKHFHLQSHIFRRGQIISCQYLPTSKSIAVWFCLLYVTKLDNSTSHAIVDKIRIVFEMAKYVRGCQLQSHRSVSSLSTNYVNIKPSTIHTNILQNTNRRKIITNH